jgi:hypothetical protein
VTAGDGHYRLTGTLPEGPGTAPVYRAAGDPGQASVAHLAALLGVSGPVRPSEGAWQVGGAPDGGGPALMVARNAPGTWSYSLLGTPATSVHPNGGKAAPNPSGATSSSSSSGSSSGSGSPGSSASPGSGSSSSDVSSSTGSAAAAPPVSVRRAEAAVRPVLRGLGLSGAHLDADTTVGALRTVIANPVIGGLPTSGWSTSFQVGSDGRIAMGYGRLSALTEAGTVRVLSAAEALQKLSPPHLMHPGAAACPAGPAHGPVKDDGTDASAPVSCPMQPSGGVVDVVGARFGLSLQFVSGRQELRPAWLFETTAPGSPHTTTMVEPAVAGQGGPTPTLPSKTPVPPPATVDPGGPVHSDPSQPVDPRAPRAVPLTAYQAAGRTLTVVFWGGVCPTYQVSVDESATQVRVRVTQTPARAGKMCPMIVKSLSRQVTLKEPLGDRSVIDTSNGRPVRGQ